MIWLLGGYVWLYVHRPFEIWPALGAIQIERGYMLGMLMVWLVWPGKGFVPNRLHYALAAFSTTLVAAWLMSPFASQPGCLEVVENYAKVAVFYVLVVTSVRDERSLRLLLLLFLATVGVYTLHSLKEYLHGRIQWRMGISRMIGVDTTFSDPNAFASTLLYTLPLILPFWYERPRRIPRSLMIGYVLLLIGCILLTGSRAGFCALCLFGFLLVVSNSKHKAQAIALGGVAALVGLLVLSVALPDELQNRYLTLLDSSRGPTNAVTSAQGRMDGIVWGFYLWGLSPLLGFGPGGFAYCTGKGMQPHNLYGQVLSEMGTVGGVALLALVLCFWYNVREMRRLHPHGTPLPFAAQVTRSVGFIVILLLALGCAGHNLYRYNWLWFAAFSAVSLHCLRRQAARAPQYAYYPVAPAPQLAWQA